jgi:hypothetical protein
MQVKRRNNESSEALIKRFTRKVKKRQYYKKPSEIAREEYFRRLAELEKQKRKEQRENDR